MSGAAFGFAAFCGEVGASAREKAPLRQDLVRGLKDYYERIYGYDRYGAETILQLPERMGMPYVFGFAMLRIVHDRRISQPVKLAVARHALRTIAYGEDLGVPYGVMAAVHLLATGGHLSTTDLRYTLTITAGEFEPFRGLTKGETIALMQFLVALPDLPVEERLFWAHSLIARHQDAPGAGDMISVLMKGVDLPIAGRQELCTAWIYQRQPRIEVATPEGDGSSQGRFVAERMPFWVAHSPSWPSLAMVRLGLVWLARLGEDASELASRYIGQTGSFAEQLHAAVADIVLEHHASMPHSTVQSVVERGIAVTGSSTTRRRFYRLGADLYGDQYLERATSDSANSVRQWAIKQRDGQTLAL